MRSLDARRRAAGPTGVTRWCDAHLTLARLAHGGKYSAQWRGQPSLMTTAQLARAKRKKCAGAQNLVADVLTLSSASNAPKMRRPNQRFSWRVAVAENHAALESMKPSTYISPVGG